MNLNFLVVVGWSFHHLETAELKVCGLFLHEGTTRLRGPEGL